MKPLRLFQRMTVMLSKYQSGRESFVKARKSWYCELGSVLLSKLRMTYGLTLPEIPLQSALTCVRVSLSNKKIRVDKSPGPGKDRPQLYLRILELTSAVRQVQSADAFAQPA